MNILKIFTKQREIGNIGEHAAAKFLKKKKFKILEKNYVALDSEVDIIAESRDTVIFVEVKTRTVGGVRNWEPRPASAVTEDKQQGILKVAKYYLTYNRKKKRVRFDVIEVFLDKGLHVTDIIHLENTFNKDTAYRRYKK